MSISSPRDISGLLVWYSAEAESGYADGQVMTGWTDLSGNGSHATASAGSGTAPKWRSAQGPSSGPAIEFTRAGSGGRFSLPNVFSALTAAEVVIYVKSSSAAVDQTLWNFAGGSSQAAHYPFSDGKVYETWGKDSADRPSFTPSLGVNAWRRYNVWSASNDWAASLDGTSQATDATNAVQFPTNPILGINLVGVRNSFGGFVTCFVAYNRKLTTTERSDLDAWFVANPSGGILPSGTATLTLSGSASGSSVAAATGSLTLSGSASANDQLATGTASLSLSAAATMSAAASATGNLSLAAGATPAAVSGATGSLTLSATAVAQALYLTDTSNFVGGRRRGGAGSSDVLVPYTPPATAGPVRVDKAIALPEPVLVNGRPT